MKKMISISKLATAFSLALLAILLAGCQSPDPITVGPNCPLCKMGIKSVPAASLAYTKHMCPGCRIVRDTGTWDEKADLTEIVVCDHCKMGIHVCPKCTE